ncbi:hypothetical protein ACSOPN_002401 [Escherichia coli]
MEFAQVLTKKTNGGLMIKTFGVSPARGYDQFARDLAHHLGIKTFEVDSGKCHTTLIVYAAWIEGGYYEKAYFDVFYDYEEKCFYTLQDL